MAEYNTDIKTSSSGHTEKSNKGKMSEKTTKWQNVR